MKKLIFVMLVVLMANVMFAGAMSAWTKETESVGNQEWLNYYCTVTPAITDSVVYTLPLDKKFNWNAPIFVLINEDGNTIDNATTAVIMYQGYSEDFALTVTDAGVATITDGWEFGSIETDVKASVGKVTLYGTGRRLADSASSYYYIMPSAELAFSIEGEALIAAEIKIRVMQLLDNNMEGKWMENCIK